MFRILLCAPNLYNEYLIKFFFIRINEHCLADDVIVKKILYGRVVNREWLAIEIGDTEPFLWVIDLLIFIKRFGVLWPVGKIEIDL